MKIQEPKVESTSSFGCILPSIRDIQPRGQVFPGLLPVTVFSVSATTRKPFIVQFLFDRRCPSVLGGVREVQDDTSIGKVLLMYSSSFSGFSTSCMAGFKSWLLSFMDILKLDSVPTILPSVLDFSKSFHRHRELGLKDTQLHRNYGLYLCSTLVEHVEWLEMMSWWKDVNYRLIPTVQKLKECIQDRMNANSRRFIPISNIFTLYNQLNQLMVHLNLSDVVEGGRETSLKMIDYNINPSIRLRLLDANLSDGDKRAKDKDFEDFLDIILTISILSVSKAIEVMKSRNVSDKIFFDLEELLFRHLESLNLDSSCFPAADFKLSKSEVSNLVVNTVTECFSSLIKTLQTEISGSWTDYKIQSFIQTSSCSCIVEMMTQIGVMAARDLFVDTQFFSLKRDRMEEAVRNRLQAFAQQATMSVTDMMMGGAPSVNNMKMMSSFWLCKAPTSAHRLNLTMHLISSMISTMELVVDNVLADLPSPEKKVFLIKEYLERDFAKFLNALTRKVEAELDDGNLAYEEELSLFKQQLTNDLVDDVDRIAVVREEAISLIHRVKKLALTKYP